MKHVKKHDLKMKDHKNRTGNGEQAAKAISNVTVISG